MARRPQRLPGSNPTRFRRSVVRDLRNRLRAALFGLLILICLHVAVMMAVEGLRLGDAIWLTFTTITTTGYGDYSARTPLGRAATIGLIYLSGIFLLTQAASAFFELRALRRQRMRRGEWRWELRDHIVFVNAPSVDPGDYLRRLLDQLHRSHAADNRVHAVVLTEAFPDGLPPSLEDDPFVVQVRGRFDDPAALEATSIDQARGVVILAEQEGERLSDSRTFDMIHRLRERGYTKRIIAECVDDRNRARLKRAGANSVVRPLRGYPEMIVRAVVAPGTEQLMEQLFSSEGDECLRFEITVRARWSDIVSRVVAANLGTPLGYAGEDGELHANPPPDDAAQVSALYVIVNEKQSTTDQTIRAALAPVAVGSPAPVR